MKKYIIIVKANGETYTETFLIGNLEQAITHFRKARGMYNEAWFYAVDQFGNWIDWTSAI